MEKILSEILADDKEILNRREDLISKLDEKVPSNLTRDCLVIKNALRLNIGEFFYCGEVDKVREILKSSGMNEARINFVVDTFTKALGLDKVPVAKEIKIETPPIKSKVEPPPPKLKDESARLSLDKKQKTNSEVKKDFSSAVDDVQEEITETFKPKNQTSDVDNEYNTVVSSPPTNISSPTNTPSSVTTTNQPTFTPPVQPNPQPSTFNATPSPQPVAQQQSDFKTTLMNYKEKLFTTEGRLNRWAYFMNGLKLFGLMILGAITSGFLIGIPILIAAVVGNWMITIRRLHDLDKSGWWSLVSFIPYVNVAFGIYVLFFKGTTGPNRFGPDPLMEL